MRDTEEQLKEILKRAEIVRSRRTVRKQLIIDAAGAVLCLVLMGASISVFPSITHVPEDTSVHQYGSILAGSPYLGYFVVFFLAFILGICTTLLLIHLKKLRDGEQ